MTAPDVTVVVPSMGRRAGVLRLVEAIEPDGARVEMVVVDNSADGIAAGGIDRPGVHLVREPQPGAAAARNRGIGTARGHVVVFVDDDVRADAATVEALAAPVLAGEAGATVGRVVLDPSVALPRWMTPPLLAYLSRYDRGDVVRDLEPDDHGLTAAMAVRRDLLEAVGGFWTGLGPRPGVHVTNDDIQLCRALTRAGVTIRYLPDAAVVHDVPADRLTVGSVLRRAHAQGRSDWLLEREWERRHPEVVLAGAARTLVGDLIGNVRRIGSGPGMTMRVAAGLARFAGTVVATAGKAMPSPTPGPPRPPGLPTVDAVGPPAPGDGTEVTVVVATYQRADRLPALVESLERQTLGTDRFAVVIVDNGTTDDTAATLRALAGTTSLDLRTVRIDINAGPVPARNAGWRSTDTEWVAFTDDDCLPEPAWLEQGLAVGRGDGRLGLVQGCTRPAVEPVQVWSATRRVEEPTLLFEGCNLFVRRHALEATGGFDDRFFFYGEDTSMGWSIIETGYRTGFADDAVVRHEVSRPPFRHRLRERSMEANLVRVARFHPGFRAQACWRPWAYRRENVLHALAVLSLIGAVRNRRLVVGALPWLVARWPDSVSSAAAVHLAKRWVDDSVGTASMVSASIRERTLLL